MSRNLTASKERQTGSRKERHDILDHSFNVFQTLNSIGASLSFFILSVHYFIISISFFFLKLDCLSVRRSRTLIFRNLLLSEDPEASDRFPFLELSGV